MVDEGLSRILLFYIRTLRLDLPKNKSKARICSASDEILKNQFAF